MMYMKNGTSVFTEASAPLERLKVAADKNISGLIYKPVRRIRVKRLRTDETQKLPTDKNILINN